MARIYFPPRQSFSPLYAPFHIHLPSPSFKFYFYSNSFVLGAIFEKPLSFFTESDMVLACSSILMNIYFWCKVPRWVFLLFPGALAFPRVVVLFDVDGGRVSVGRTSPSEWSLSGWVQDTPNQDDLLSLSGFSKRTVWNLWNSLPILIHRPLFLEMIFPPCPSAILRVDDLDK